jgi:hypothetical protein
MFMLRTAAKSRFCAICGGQRGAGHGKEVATFAAAQACQLIDKKMRDKAQSSWHLCPRLKFGEGK